MKSKHILVQYLSLQQVLTFILAIFLADLIVAQTDSVFKNRYESTFIRPHYTVKVGTLFNLGTIENVSGKQALTPKVGTGYYFSFLYTTHLNTNVSIEIGAEIGELPINYLYDLTPSDYPFLFNDIYNAYPTFHTKLTTPYYAMPIYFVYRKVHPKNHKLFFNAKVGLSIRHTPPGFIILTEETVIPVCDCANDRVIFENIELLEIEVDGSNTDDFPSEWQFNPRVSLGISKILKNYTIVNFSILYNFSFQEYLRLPYTVFPEPKYSDYSNEGFYKSRGSYIGLELSYSWGGIKKALKK